MNLRIIIFFMNQAKIYRNKLRTVLIIKFPPTISLQLRRTNNYCVVKITMGLKR